MDKKLATNLSLVLVATIAILGTVCTPKANARSNSNHSPSPQGTIFRDEKMDYTPPAPPSTGRYRRLVANHRNTSSSTDDPNCGEKAGGRSCKKGLCCSQWGYCGSTDDHCGYKCQPLYGSCGHGDDGSEPPSQAPCSCDAAEYSVLDESSAVLDHDDEGSCGKEGGGGTCRDNLCCSKYGYCGSKVQYCGAGCQSGYGRCHGGGGGDTPPGGGGHTPPPRHRTPPPRHHNPPQHHSPSPSSSAPSPCTC